MVIKPMSKFQFNFWSRDYFKNHVEGSVFKDIYDMQSIISYEPHHLCSLTLNDPKAQKKATIYYPVIKALVAYLSVMKDPSLPPGNKISVSNIEIESIKKVKLLDYGISGVEVVLTVINSKGEKKTEGAFFGENRFFISGITEDNELYDYDCTQNKGYSLMLACLLENLLKNFMTLDISVDSCFYLSDYVYRHILIANWVSCNSCSDIQITRIIYENETINIQDNVKEERRIDDLRKDFLMGTDIVNDMPDYIPSENLITIADMTKNVGMRKFMLRGAAGCGKTTDAKALARVLGLPRFVFTCSENTDEMALISTFIPDNGEFKMINSSIVDACMQPSVCEIQEPACISKPATLVALNSLLDDDAIIRLVSGETIKKNPDTIFVFTTNVDYRGCRGLNESVISRMDMVIDYLDVDYNTMTDRVMEKYKISHEKDNDIRQMAFAINKLQEFIKTEGIIGAVCGPREFENWVKMYLHTNDKLFSCQSTVLTKITTEKEVYQEILDCIKLVVV